MIKRFVITSLAACGAYFVLPRFVPGLYHTAFSVGNDGAGFSATWLLVVCLVIAVLTWKAVK